MTGVSRRGFLQRLTVVAAGAGLMAVAPTVAVEAIAPITEPPVVVAPPSVEVVPAVRQVAYKHDPIRLLTRMSRIGDDEFLSSTDTEVHWRWQQVRSIVITAYGRDGRRKLIALPPVGDAIFLPNEPGYAEWRRCRLAMYTLADKALEIA